MADKEILTLAIQKSGRLSDKTRELLRESGIEFGNGNRDQLKSISTNFPIQVLYLRDDDIPDCVNDDIADAGIAGENIFMERDLHLNTVQKLGFGRCRLSLALPKFVKFESVRDFEGMKIATSYPAILQKFLDAERINAAIHRIHGSVEITPSIGIADAVFDIVSTGGTLAGNGLREVHTVLHSEAVLVAGQGLSSEKRKILDRLIFRIQAVMRSRNHKYILLNCPDDSIESISGILPGMKSPTVMPLAREGWSSLHSVITEDDFWENIDALKAAGAEGILVIPIEKMIL